MLFRSFFLFQMTFKYQLLSDVRFSIKDHMIIRPRYFLTIFNTEYNIRKQLIFEGHLKEEDTEESDDDSDESNDKFEDENDNKNESDNLKSVNTFMVPNSITMSSMTSSTSWLIDSGAGLSGRVYVLYCTYVIIYM